MDDDLHDLFGEPPLRARDGESAARLAVERALAALQDPAARVRVLRWALERFGADPQTSRDQAAAPSDTDAPAKPPDRSVSVDDLADLFDAPGDPGELPIKGDPPR